MGDKQSNSAPFATVAMAGHVIPSIGYCPCDGTNCPTSQGLQGLQHSSGQHSTDTAASDNEVANGVDPAAGVILLTFALLFGFRLRF